MAEPAKRAREIALIYTAGLVQGLALIAFPAASDVFTSADFHGLRAAGTAACSCPW